MFWSNLPHSSLYYEFMTILLETTCVCTLQGDDAPSPMCQCIDKEVGLGSTRIPRPPLRQGYRDAQCAWLTLPQQPPPAGGKPTSEGPSSSDAPAAVRSRKRAKQELFEVAPDTEVDFLSFF